MQNDISTTTVAETIITGVAGIIGVFIGHVLALRQVRRHERTQRRKEVVSGICALSAELKENSIAIKTCKGIKTNTWEVVKYQYWFISPVITKQIEDQLYRVYALLGEYEKELSIAKATHPENQTEIIQKFITDNQLISEISTLTESLQNCAEKFIGDLLGRL
jgi:hypothetical protein